ncbi:MAG: sigma-54 dependent transcriptional regulator [Thermodesulfovibrionales bacterium]|nr:sigma-54 dependent transcriptional regulator [Thermodesulfovibrionales bacterium]
MDRHKILVIDDEEIVRVSCLRSLSAKGYSVKTAKSGTEGLMMLDKSPFDVVLTDLKMPDMDGIEVLTRIKDKSPDTEIIVITGYGTVSSAVQAMKYGAFDYIEKPFTPDALSEVTGRALERRMLFIECRKPVKTPIYIADDIIGNSSQIQQVFHSIAVVAPTKSTVLITGESGTGKELVAKAIHFNSTRKDKAFVVVDCGTIPETLIESELFGYVKGAFTGAQGNRDGLLKTAHEGTIFLDEIGNLNLSTQGKLLRVLQENEFRPLGAKYPLKVDLRFIAATNSDLSAMVKSRSFREDIFYRLNVFPITLPSLRNRKEDIPLLSRFFLKKYQKDPLSLSAEAMRLLMAYDWPGNIRELENTIERAALVSGENTIHAEHLSFLIPKTSDDIPRTCKELKEIKKTLRLKSVEELEKAFLLNALERNNWNITKTADDVGMQRTNFHALLKKHGLSKTE